MFEYGLIKHTSVSDMGKGIRNGDHANTICWFVLAIVHEWQRERDE